MAKKHSISIPRDARTGEFVVGRARFEKISAVEGVVLSTHSKQLFASMDRKGHSAAERRQAIIRKHSKQSA